MGLQHRDRQGSAKLGFKEIQFDYVRFPEGFEKRADSLKYTKTDQSRVDVVSDFVQYARKNSRRLASAYPLTSSAMRPRCLREGIGQDFVKISKTSISSVRWYTQAITAGWFGSPVPDKAPYQTIKGSMEDTHKKLEELGEQKPIIRPWIQDFTASWLGSGNMPSTAKGNRRADSRPQRYKRR